MAIKERTMMHDPSSPDRPPYFSMKSPLKSIVSLLARSGLLLFLSVTVLSNEAPEAFAQTEAVRIDGSRVVGKWLGSEDGTVLRIEAADGLARIPIDDLASVSFAASPASSSAPVTFFLSDGGMVHGLITASVSSALIVDTALAAGATLPFEDLAAVRFNVERPGPKELPAFENALQNRLPAQDILITREEDPKSLRGRLESLDMERGAFMFGDRTRTVSANKICGIVFAAAARTSPEYPLIVEFTDGSRLAARQILSNEKTVRLNTTIAEDLLVPIERVTALRFRTDRIVYLSDLAPTQEKTEGLLHRPWPVQRDRSAAGTPLSMAGRRFEKGLGVHAFTELTFELRDAYEGFAATVGLDDAVRPNGRVVFRVLGTRAESTPDQSAVSGRPVEGTDTAGQKALSTKPTTSPVQVTLWESGTITGSDPPTDVLLDVTGLSELTLVVDYGDGIDLADHANWGGARLIRPVEKTRTSSR